VPCGPPEQPPAVDLPTPPAVDLSGSLTATSEATPKVAGAAIPVFTYKVVKSYPHDRAAFTEGLVFDKGALYEGTGLNGQSTLRRVDLETGAVQQSCGLPTAYFGEGVTTFGGKIVQLTWQTHVGFVYDKDSFGFQQSFTYPTEGWGLTHDDKRLIMSDGTPTIRFLDPETLREVGHIDVYDDQGPVVMLNELEYIQGKIYANVWQTNRIAQIDPQTGQVVGWIDLTDLLSPEDMSQPVDVLNGIAYDAAQDRLFVTGKLWPKLFEIKLVPKK